MASAPFYGSLSSSPVSTPTNSSQSDTSPSKIQYY